MADTEATQKNCDERRTALITGASSGIGAAYADRLAKCGFDLVLVARTEQRLNAPAGRLAAETGVKVEVLTADLTSRSDVRRVEHRLRSDDSITLFINNAGMGMRRPVLAEEIDWLEGVVELNVVAAHRLAIAATQTFAARGGRGIINISSIAVLHPRTSQRDLQRYEGFRPESHPVASCRSGTERGQAAGGSAGRRSNRVF